MTGLALRHKGTNTAIEDVHELDEYIRQIGRLDRAMERNGNEMNEALEKVKKHHLGIAQQLQAQRDSLLVQVEAYAAAHKSELLPKKGQKTAALNWGKLGWRKLKDTILGFPKRNTDRMQELIDKIRAFEDRTGMHLAPLHCEEFVLKTDLNKADDVSLVAIGLVRKPGTEEFFVEPDRERLRELEDGPR